MNILNENDVIVDSFEGIATGGNISLDGSSTYRRSGNMSMLFNKKYNLIPKPDSKIWFNKRVEIKVGLEDHFKEVIWFNMGRFAIDEVSLNLTLSEKTISCQLKDYMSLIDGTLGGKMSHRVVIDEGTPINEAIKSVLSGLGKVSVEDMKINGIDLKLPYTIEKEVGSTVYEIAMEIVNLYQGYDFYCDENGYYTVEKIRDKKNDPIIDTFDGTDSDMSIDMSPSMDFKNVKNSIWIWGRQLDDGTQIKWSYKNKYVRNYKTDLNNIRDMDNGDICHIENEDSSYMWDSKGWVLLDFKVNPTFNIENIGEKIFSESDSNIFNENQAKMKAEYEIQQRSNMAETIGFSCVPLYYLDVFNKIHINIDNDIKGDYLITGIGVPLDISSTMTITSEKLNN